MSIPTKKQKALLDYIESFTDDNNVSPTYREIANALGLSSIASVAQRIDNCVDAGFLEKRPREARSLRVLTHEDNSEVARLFRQKIAALNAESAANSEDPSLSELDHSLAQKTINDKISILKRAAKILGVRL